MRHALIIVIVGVWSTVAFPTSVHAQEQCSPSDRTCATFPPLISPYDPEYLATTPEKIDGAGPGCVKGQTNPRLPGTCGPVGSPTPRGRTCPGAVDSSAPSRIQAPPRRSSPAWWRDTQDRTAILRAGKSRMSGRSGCTVPVRELMLGKQQWTIHRR